MSGKFSSTSGSFSSVTLKQEEYIRQIASNECLLVLQEIKGQIEAKVKSIDRNITDLRNEVRRLQDSHKFAQINEILDRMEKIQAQIKILRYHHQNTLKVSRTKSLEKQRKPIFKREDQIDFSSVILGLESESEVKSQKRIFDKRELNAKPPLPITHTPKAKIQNKFSVEQSKKIERSIVKRNPILDDSGSIHKWLHQNNNRQSSCFSSIIRQEDIEQSVFY